MLCKSAIDSRGSNSHAFESCTAPTARNTPSQSNISASVYGRRRSVAPSNPAAPTEVCVLLYVAQHLHGKSRREQQGETWNSPLAPVGHRGPAPPGLVQVVRLGLSRTSPCVACWGMQRQTYLIDMHLVSIPHLLLRKFSFRLWQFQCHPCAVASACLWE